MIQLKGRGGQVPHQLCSAACRLDHRNFSLTAPLPASQNSSQIFVSRRPDTWAQMPLGSAAASGNGVLTYNIATPAVGNLEGHFAGHGMAGLTVRSSSVMRSPLRPNDDAVGALVLPGDMRIGVVCDGVSGSVNAHRGAAAIVAITQAWFTTLGAAELPQSHDEAVHHLLHAARVADRWIADTNKTWLPDVNRFGSAAVAMAVVSPSQVTRMRWGDCQGLHLRAEASVPSQYQLAGWLQPDLTAFAGRVFATEADMLLAMVQAEKMGSGGGILSSLGRSDDRFDRVALQTHARQPGDVGLLCTDGVCGFNAASDNLAEGVRSAPGNFLGAIHQQLADIEDDVLDFDVRLSVCPNRRVVALTSGVQDDRTILMIGDE